jgi:hypothetical protein
MPPPGTVLKDLTRDTYCEFQAFLDGVVWVRPVGGGCEWTVHPNDVRRATYAEKNRARATASRPVR